MVGAIITGGLGYTPSLVVTLGYAPGASVASESEHTMPISVAINGSKTRNLQLYAGDTVTLTLTVYAEDGDTEAIDSDDIENARIVTHPSGIASLPVGSAFTVPDVCGTFGFRLIAEVDGDTLTLCDGTVTIKGASRSVRWDYGWGWL